MKLNTPIVVVAAILILMGILIAIVPQFTNCGSEGKEIALPNGKTVPMKCFWTGRSELIPGIILLALGVMMLIARHRESRLLLSIAALVAGIFVILMPTFIIGTCATPTMVCNTLMKPIVLVLGALAILASIGGLVLSIKEKE
jgi:hypothetical protein